ncbi:MAG: chromosome segregation in meiosis- protein [Geoglossum simile]|nr:MAG: chromosome segregation in meiosis- protein [Geoglossum simile]
MATEGANPFLGSYLNGDSSPEPESRPRIAASTAQPARDDLDDLFDYDPGIDSIFQDVDTNMDAPTATAKGGQSTSRKGKSTTTALGIDEEVQITRKKRINVKLDENRLLSQSGIPKLRRITKQRLHFKGKGHEYTDTARMLSLYQLWLDDLFPKAKFADALAIVEKLGHSKRMQVMRKEWIEEGTVKARDGNYEGEEKLPNSERDVHNLFSDNSNGENGQNNGNVAQENLFGDAPLDDELDLYSSPKPRKPTALPSNRSSDSLFVSDGEAPPPKNSLASNDNAQPEPDELDELLNDGALGLGGLSNAIGGPTGGAVKAPVVPAMGSRAQMEDDFEDEMEAMMGLDDVW